MVKLLVLFPEEHLYHRREHRLGINVVLMVQLLESAGFTKVDDAEGFQRSMEESPEPGEREGVTVKECDRWHASLGSR